MSDETTLDFAAVQAIITTEDTQMHACELHGVITGLICAGFSYDNGDYVNMIKDLFNNGENLPNKVNVVIKLMYAQIWQEVLDDSYSFKIMLPDDDEAITERGHGLGAWVQGFNLGFGLQQKSTAKFSDDVKEVLADFAEIANISDDMEESEESEQAYFEIAEYIRISALLCFSELGMPPTQPKKETIH